MDKPTTSGGSGSTKLPWPEDSGSESSFGATGVFGTISLPVPPEASAAAPGTESGKARSLPPSVLKPPQPTPGAKALQEPVVHKVVFGGSADDKPAELLDRIRAVSAERAAITDKPAAPAAGGQGSGGFTELLRSIGGDAGAPAPAVVPVPAPQARPAAPVSGFTSLLQTLNAPETKAPAAANPIKPMQVELRAAPAEPSRANPAPAPGSFTELLRVTGTGEPESGSAPAPNFGFGELGGPGPSSPSPVSPAPIENKQGTFTQLFSTFGAAEPSAPAPVAREAEGAYSGGGAGSFTRMLSLEQQSAAPAPAYREERTVSAGDPDYGFRPGAIDRGATDAAATSRDPFSQALPEVEPVAQNTPQSSGVGITRLIQMLDEPATAPVPAAPAPTVSAPAGEGPGVWTRTFASLDSPGEAKPAAANPPGWTPPPGVKEFTPSVTPADFRPAGPSEFTRILDASRLREEAMKGGPAAGGIPAAAAPAQGFGPHVPPVAMPGFPAAAPAMPGMRPTPQPGGYALPQTPPAPAFPMNFAAPAVAMPAPPASLPPAVKAPQPGAGKLQAYVPLLLAMIIVLLVVLLVTVIFLMKH